MTGLVAFSAMSAGPVPARSAMQDATGRAPSLNDAWRWAIDHCGAAACIGLLAGGRGPGRGTVFIARGGGVDVSRLAVEAIRRWLEERRDTGAIGHGGWLTVDGDDLGALFGSAVPGAKSAMVGLVRSGCDGDFWIVLTFVGDVGNFDRSRGDAAAGILALCAAGHAAQNLASRRVALLERMLDELAPGFVLVDAHARILWANAPADALLADRRVLLRAPDGRIGTASCQRTTDLREAIAAAASEWRPDRIAADRVLPLPEEEGAALLIVRAFATAPATAPAVLLTVPAHDLQASARNLAGAFGIIRSEARFIAAIVAHGSVQAAALALGLSVQTSRTYLKRIYAKLGIGSQFELASFVASLTPPLRTLEGGERVAAID